MARSRRRKALEAKYSAVSTEVLQARLEEVQRLLKTVDHWIAIEKLKRERGQLQAVLQWRKDSA